MKRSRSQRSRKLGTACSEDDITATPTSDSDEQDDATYETDVTEADDAPSPRKRLRSDENCTALELEVPGESGEFYDDPLDDDGIDLSEIPEDFDKAPGTIERRERIETRWKRYCVSQVLNKPNEPKWREPEEALRQASNNDMYRFLGWYLKLERGKNNRRLKRINKASSLNTEWKNLRGYYQKLTKIKINDEDGSNGMKYLVQEHGLDTQPGKKTPVYIEDIGPFNETILSTQEKKFYLGFQRIQVCLFNSLALFTVHRRNALLSMQFKDLQISLQKDPRGGPPIPMIELTPEGTKKFLSLTKLYELVNGVPTLQRTVQMFKSAMSTLLVTFGEIRGWKGAFHAHQFLYGSGKVINESGWVSKEQHMLIMKHASPRMFLDHYHPLQLDTDMIRVIYGLDPDVELMRAVTRQSRWRDMRRPRYLTDQQRAQLEDHPELEEARRNLSKIRAQYKKTQQPALRPRIQQLERNVRNTQKRLHRSLRHKIRKNFDEEQAFLNIEAQLSGTMVKEESKDESFLKDTIHPLQLHLVQSLLSYPISNSLEDEWNWRDTGAAAVVQYCDVLEGGLLKGRPKRNVSGSATSPGPINQPQDTGQTQNAANSYALPFSVSGKPSCATKEYLENFEKPEAGF
ncbi:hypothetical protein BO82DRAFT_407201 [Aspergillus uvarum CBS 121591]|uniref:C2H2 finger domain protein n=1 Tax=Aspergillus uvarum CBS 121591 TaxID=1448315 RepID=A0A319CLM3_9EURO|nr:hypothetical protein BO82DRAFT_407201 [Aspergillus uvarum CBS 121591]PYH76328.1 hypothetical protein BO82DRAFT_407201 [Aspergillus uvarum CBS 121591]